MINGPNVLGIFISGFFIVGIVLFVRGQMSAAFLSLFLVLVGMIVGYLFARGLDSLGGAWGNSDVRHTLGLTVFLVAALLVVLFLSGKHRRMSPVLIELACAFGSF